MHPFVPRKMSFIGLLVLPLVPFVTSGQNLSFEYYTTANGLLSNGTTALYQDSRGYLHIGSAEGLSTFDGYSFQHTRTRDGLPSNFVNSINELHSFPGVLWVSTTNGLARIEGDHISTVFLDTTALSRFVYSVHEDRTGQVWCCTKDGLYIMSIQGAVTKVHLPVDQVSQVEVAGSTEDSLVWVAVNNLLFALTPAREVMHRIQLTTSPFNHFTAAYLDRSGCVWIGLRDSTLALYRAGQLVRRHLIPTGRVLHLMEDREEMLHVGTENGMLSFPASGFRQGMVEHLTVENGLPGRRVIGGLVDAEGDLWLSCDDFGIAKLKTLGLQEFSIPNIPLAYNNMRGVCDSTESFWVLSDEHIVEVRRLSGTWRRTEHRLVGIPGSPPSGVVRDRMDQLWIVHNKGRIRSYAIQVKANGQRELRPRAEHLDRTPSRAPWLFMVDSRNRQWWTDTSHLVVLHGTKLRKYNLVALVGETDVRTMIEDSKGNIWLGGFSKGIAIIPGDPAGGTPRSLEPHVDIPAGFIRAFCEDRFGRMWVGTRYDGCMIFDGDSTRTLSTSDALPSDAVWTIARDSSGMMWLGTSLGLVAIDPTTFLPDPISTDIVREIVVSSSVSRDGIIWYVTPSGVGIVDRSKLRTSSAVLNVRIAHFEVNGTPVANLTERLAFRYDQNNCVFSFLASTLRNTKDVVYQYRLIGTDDKWQQPTRDHSVVYAALRPGKYTFEVRATRGSSVQFGNTTSVSFTILPPFWATWWFITLSVLAVGGVIATVVQARVRRLLELERLRTRIARDLHDEIGSNLSSIAMATDLLSRRTEFSERERGKLSDISSVALKTVKDMKDIVWLIKPGNDSLDDLFLRMKDTAATLLDGLKCILDFPVDPVEKEVNLEWRQNVYLIYKEALTNIVKHAHAASASVTARVDANTLTLIIEDAGKGFDPKSVSGGSGLKNMRDRAELLKADFAVDSALDGGTRIRLRAQIT